MGDADTMTSLLHAIDGLDWEEIRRCLADQVLVDYTEVFGGEVETVSGEELVARWRALLPGFDATQHMTGPVLLTSDDRPGLRADTHVRAYHRLGDESWAVNGHYVARLVDGKITELTLQLFYQEGNQKLAESATQRARTAPRAPRPA